MGLWWGIINLLCKIAEEEEKPADLTQRVIFKATKSKSLTSGEEKASKTKDSKTKAQTSKLSFADDEEEETED